MKSLTSQKRVSKTSRVYSGKQDADPVIRWLNQNAGNRDGRRVAILIADLTTLCGSVQPKMYLFPPREEMARFKREHPGLYRSISPGEAVERDLMNRASWVPINLGRGYDRQAMRRAQATLARYSFRPYIFDDLSDGEVRGFQVEMLPSRFFTPGQRITIADIEGVGRELESWTILRVIRLTRDGAINKIRRCSCGNWFFAQHSRRQWCSSRCRHRDYKSTPEWRAKRNRYMRKYYRENYSSQSGKFREGGR